MPEITKAILLVEDSDDDVLFFKRALKLAAVANPVIRLSSAEEAIAYLSGTGQYSDRALFPLPFAVILDLRLPGVDGTEVLKWIRSRPQFEKTLVVILSGSARSSTAHTSLELGANSFLNKPAKADDLRTLTQNFPGDWQTHSA